MFVKVNESDIVVVSYLDGRIKVIYDEDSDVYCLIWRRESDGEFQLMWRGKYKDVMREFGEITDDLELERTDPIENRIPAPAQ